MKYVVAFYNREEMGYITSTLEVCDCIDDAIQYGDKHSAKDLAELLTKGREGKYTVVEVEE